jgi:hypothetical protein
VDDSDSSYVVWIFLVWICGSDAERGQPQLRRGEPIGSPSAEQISDLRVGVPHLCRQGIFIVFCSEGSAEIENPSPPLR